MRRGKKHAISFRLCILALAAVLVAGGLSGCKEDKAAKNAAKAKAAAAQKKKEEARANSYHHVLPPDQGKPVVKILFLGNDDATANDMPRMVAWIAASVGDETLAYDVELVAGDDSKLYDHAQNRDVVEKIAQTRYAAVVMQDKGDIALDPDEAYTSAIALRSLALAAQNTGAAPFFFGTWSDAADAKGARKKKKKKKSGKSARGAMTPEDMLRKTDLHYLDAAAKAGAPYVPVGQYWMLAGRADPKVSLHGKDGGKPTTAGSYLTALVLYAALSQRSPADVTWAPDEITAQQAAFLRRVASQETR